MKVLKSAIYPMNTSRPEIVCLLVCDSPERRISVDGKIFVFEMHPRCGPVALNRRGEPSENQPQSFLRAASLWIEQGQRVEGGLCFWEHPPAPITKHVGGRHHRITGWHQPTKGE